MTEFNNESEIKKQVQREVYSQLTQLIHKWDEAKPFDSLTKLEVFYKLRTDIQIVLEALPKEFNLKETF